MSKIICFSSLSQIFCESHFQKSKNNPVEVLTGGCPSGFPWAVYTFGGFLSPHMGGQVQGDKALMGGRLMRGT